MTRLLVPLAALALVAACVDAPPVTPDAGTPDPTPDAGVDPDGCTVVTLGAQDFQANLFGQLTGVRFPVSPEIDGALPEALLVELYDSTTPGLPALETGTFDLAEENGSLVTCQHCVYVPVDFDYLSPLAKAFVVTAGSMTLTSVEDPLGPVFAGSTTELVLREATFDDAGATLFVTGGRCLRVPAFSFDTSPTPGRDCVSAEDCGNPLLEICSPVTATCAPHECGDFVGCPAERPMCISQYGGMLEGACYAVCDPRAPTSCGAGLTCIQRSVDPGFGVCMRTGSALLGDACEVEDTSTSCAPGLACSAGENACIRTCRSFAEEPGCPANHVCSVLGMCDAVESGVAVPFGEPCGDSAVMAQGCASDGKAFRGICFAFDPTEPLTCAEACFDDLGCEEGEFCALRFSSGLGVCLPDPVCGDGALGEIGEVCDDGNDDSGDGCSADCQTVEYDVICPQASVLAVGDTTGDTATARDGFKATCQLGLARTEVYRFDPPSRGRLRVTLESATQHVVSVRSDCATDASEAACVTTDFSGTGELTYQVTTDAPLTVLVAAFTVLEQGPFTVHTEFVPESCGDGVVAGLEVCDDGNTDANDGCNADCSAIEYGFYCGAAQALTSTLSGDNTGATSLYAGSCANSVLGSGPDRLYTYTAASAGTLRVRLTPEGENAQDLVLAVFDGCGAPSSMTELDCSSVYDVEEVEVAVTANQTVTILVEGFHPFSQSPYTLTAELVP